MQRFSPKRQAIIECLCSTKSHPTAEWIYERIHEEYPSISLTTVYRNLRQLQSEGRVRSVGFFEGHEHFDGDASVHTHAYCKQCSSIIDLDIPVITPEKMEQISEMTGFEISDAGLCFEGLCKNCQSSNQM